MHENIIMYFIGAGIFMGAIWPLPMGRYFLAWGAALIMMYSHTNGGA